MAMNDSLTGFPNRVSLQEELARQLFVARASGTKLGVVTIDLNRFKEINDVHGHKAGDGVLSSLAQRMADLMGRHEMIARLGGDEFVAVIRFDQRARLIEFTERLKVALEAPLSIGGFDVRVGASIGVAIFPD